MIVSQILKSKSETGVISVRPDASVSEAVGVLSEKRIGTLVVAKEAGGLDGIVSERDIVREMGRQGVALMTEPVSKIMTSKLVTCGPSDTADGVLEMMTKGRFRHMPVVDDGTMVGLISIGDVVKARLSELSMEKDALEGMIMGH